MGTVVLDSSVVIGFLDKADAHHPTAAQAIAEHHRAGDELVITTSVLAEVLVGAGRISAARLDRVRVLLRAMFGSSRVISEEIAARAAMLRAAHRSLRLPDALVIAAGLVDDVDAIVTLDKRWKGVHDKVRVLGG
jgi:predicted nucleic acid-binding protein